MQAEGVVWRPWWQVVVSWFWAMMLGSGSSSSVPGLHPNFCTGASSVLAELGI